MNVAFTLIASLGLGYFVRNRNVAVLVYLIADSFVFTFQTVDVLLNWMGANGGIGGAKAFGPFPTRFPITYRASEIYAYGAVNLVITAAGIGLAIAANKLAVRRNARKESVSVG